MKKLLRDLTVKEIHDICAKYSPKCNGCPFEISGVYYDDDEHEECLMECTPNWYDCYFNNEIELDEEETNARSNK